MSIISSHTALFLRTGSLSLCNLFNGLSLTHFSYFREGEGKERKEMKRRERDIKREQKREKKREREVSR